MQSDLKTDLKELFFIALIVSVTVAVAVNACASRSRETKHNPVYFPVNSISKSLSSQTRCLN